MSCVGKDEDDEELEIMEESEEFECLEDASEEAFAEPTAEVSLTHAIHHLLSGSLGPCARCSAVPGLLSLWCL